MALQTWLAQGVGLFTSRAQSSVIFCGQPLLANQRFSVTAKVRAGSLGIILRFNHPNERTATFRFRYITLFSFTMRLSSLMTHPPALARQAIKGCPEDFVDVAVKSAGCVRCVVFNPLLSLPIPLSGNAPRLWEPEDDFHLTGRSSARFCTGPSFDDDARSRGLPSPFG